MSAPSPLKEFTRPPTSHVKRSPRQGRYRVSPLTQALDLKDIAYKHGTDEKTPVQIKAALMRAWVDLQEIAMAIRGQGKPKPVEARNGSKRSKVTNAAPVSERNSEPTIPTNTSDGAGA